MKPSHVFTALAICLALCLHTASAQAQETVPNHTLMQAGLFAFAAGYAPAIIVASASELDADKQLYVPVAGPWLDLGQRPNCHTDDECRKDTGNKLLIIGDGLVQGIGALEIAMAFLFTEPAPGYAPSPRLSIAPGTLGRGAYGMRAVGTF